MLSYRHEFHAGSHADVFKHVVLCELLRYLTEKPKPLWYVDTHAGAGQYELGRRPVSGAEAATGIFRLWGVPDLPPAVQHYLGLVAAANPAGELRRYPGSPWLAAAMLRKEDRLWLSELHPADHATLLEVLGQRDRRARIEQRDGLAWLRVLLPPVPRRGLVLIDPSFEVKKEYRDVVAAIEDARRRFESGVYAVWYPLLRLRAAAEFPAALERVAGASWLHARFWVCHPTETGLYGSGMFVVNPPYTLAATLGSALPRLVELLAQDAGAGYSVDSRQA